MSFNSLQLSVYLDETDMAGDIPRYEVIVRRLLHLQIAGATVHRGVMGYGKHGKVHRSRLFGVSDDRPIMITAIDSEVKIRAVLSEIRGLVPEGLVTITPVEIIE